MYIVAWALMVVLISPTGQVEMAVNPYITPRTYAECRGALQDFIDVINGDRPVPERNATRPSFAQAVMDLRQHKKGKAPKGNRIEADCYRIIAHPLEDK